MEPLRVSYRGLPLELTPVCDEDESRVYGYGIVCQSCRKEFFLNTGIGRKPDHYLSRNDKLQITILPAIRCPFRCGWCIWITDDIAHACQRRDPMIAPGPKSV